MLNYITFPSVEFMLIVIITITSLILSILLHQVEALARHEPETGTLMGAWLDWTNGIDNATAFNSRINKKAILMQYAVYIGDNATQNSLLNLDTVAKGLDEAESNVILILTGKNDNILSRYIFL